MKKITLMLLAALFAVVTRAADPVVPPSTATVETWYTVDGSFYISSSTWIEYTQNMASINLAIDGDDIYLQGLALKTGIQPGFEVNDKVKVTTSGTTVEMGLEKALKAAGVDCSVKSVDFAIPFGLSYEYRNFQVDARYNLSLTKAVEADGESARHSVFQITLGYKFGL